VTVNGHRLARRATIAISAGMWIAVSSVFVSGHAAKVAALGPDQMALFEQAQNSIAEAALQTVADTALALGHWAPASGDEIAFDAGMARNVRGAVLVPDTAPFECSDRKLSRGMDACQRDFTVGQNLVRFGPSLFSTVMSDGSREARPVFDDLLSTYIEKTGHSWQEYLNETEGRSTGECVHPTTWEETVRYQHGWEYQVKAYILSLDGSLIRLSSEERHELYVVICDAKGYANPMGDAKPSYGPPADWPNPQGWPVSAPTADEFAAFCAGSPA